MRPIAANAFSYSSSSSSSGSVRCSGWRFVGCALHLCPINCVDLSFADDGFFSSFLQTASISVPMFILPRQIRCFPARNLPLLRENDRTEIWIPFLRWAVVVRRRATLLLMIRFCIMPFTTTSALCTLATCTDLLFDFTTFLVPRRTRTDLSFSGVLLTRGVSFFLPLPPWPSFHGATGTVN